MLLVAEGTLCSVWFPRMIGRDFLTPARAVEDMGGKTLGIWTGVDDVIVSRAEHWAFAVECAELAQKSILWWIPSLSSWTTKETAFSDEKKACFVSNATILINSRGGSSACEQKVSRSRQKNVAQLPHHDEHPRHCTVCSVLCDVDPVCHEWSHETLCAKCVLNVDENALLR